MDPVILDQIEFKLSNNRVYKRLRIKKGSSQEELALRMIEEALQIGRPKAMYTISGIDKMGDSWVVLDGVQMDSRIMRVNLSDIHRVFPYITTSGVELYDWKTSQNGILEQFYAEEINQMALGTAADVLLKHLKETYQLGKTATMNPGSLDDWPLPAQRSLFQLLGNPSEAIGVQLQESMLMLPNATVSGIRFASESDFSSCELCPRGKCSHRRAPYDKDLYQNKYQQ